MWIGDLELCKYEEHFSIICPKYDSIRQCIFIVNGVRSMPTQNQLTYLMRNQLKYLVIYLEGA